MKKYNIWLEIEEVDENDEDYSISPVQPLKLSQSYNSLKEAEHDRDCIIAHTGNTDSIKKE